MATVDLQELVRLHRLGRGSREIARALRCGPNTEREYRQLLDVAGLLQGAADEAPAWDALRAAVEGARPAKRPPQEVSSAERWSAQVDGMRRAGLGPQVIWDRLRESDPGFCASLSAIKRLCLRLRASDPVRPEDVVIPAQTAPGEVAQVDFGFVGQLRDAAGALRKVWAFVMVLGYSRRMWATLCLDQSAETWARVHIEAFEALGGVPRTLVPLLERAGQSVPGLCVNAPTSSVHTPIVPWPAFCAAAPTLNPRRASLCTDSSRTPSLPVLRLIWVGSPRDVPHEAVRRARPHPQETAPLGCAAIARGPPEADARRVALTHRVPLLLAAQRGRAARRQAARPAHPPRRLRGGAVARGLRLRLQPRHPTRRSARAGHLRPGRPERERRHRRARWRRRPWTGCCTTPTTSSSRACASATRPTVNAAGRRSDRRLRRPIGPGDHALRLPELERAPWSLDRRPSHALNSRSVCPNLDTLGRRGRFWEVATEERRRYPHHRRREVPWWLCRYFSNDIERAAVEAPLPPREDRVARFGRPTIVEQFDSLPLEDFQ